MLEADSLIDATTDAIAADGGFKNFFTDDDSETLFFACINSKNQGYFWIPDCFTILIGTAYPTARMKTEFA